MKNWQKILIGLVSIGIIGGIYGYKEWTRTAESMSSRKAEFVATANDFGRDYNDEKHLGKVVEISGIIAAVDEDSGKKSLTLDTSDPLTAIVCEMDSTVQKLNLTEGTATTLRCQCDGKLSDIQLSRCVLIQK